MPNNPQETKVPILLTKSITDAVDRLEIYRGQHRMTREELIEDAIRLYVEEYDALNAFVDEHTRHMGEEDTNGPIE